MRLPTHVISALRVIPAIVLLSVAGTTLAANHQAQEEKCPADSPVNRQACLREVAAARQAARTGGLTNPDQATLERNALARCNVFKTPDDHRACEERVRNNRAAGSVAGGGTLLRSEIIISPPQK